MSTFIRMPTHGSIRLHRAWRSIIEDGNSGIVVALKRNAARKYTDFRAAFSNRVRLTSHAYRKLLGGVIKLDICVSLWLI